MKIHESKIAPNPRRVRIFLAEKGIPMEYVELDLLKGDNRTAEFQRKNPMAKVPVLELDDGSCISETMAICRYFEELHPEPPMMGSSPLEKARIEMWQRWLEFYFLMPTGMCFQHTTGSFKDRMTPVPEWGEVCGRNAEAFFDFMNQHLAEHRYFAGDAFSVADITALCTVDFNKINRLGIKPEQNHLQRWYDDVSSRASAKA